ncbi:MAG: DsrE family protein [Planctomycetota bacterium]
MRQYRFILRSVFLMTVLSCCGCIISHTEKHPEQSVTADAEKLAVLWTSGDPFVAHKVCFMYTHNAKKAGWWNEVQLIVWGPSSKLLAEDKDLQTAVKAMMADGVVTKACKACADSYGVSDDLAALGIEVKYMGKPLTEMLKSDQWQVLTF